MAEQKLLKHSVDVTVSLNSKVFPILRDLEDVDYSFFTEEEVKEVKDRVMKFKTNPHDKKNNGGYIGKELLLVESFKEGLLTHVNNIREALKPKEVSRTTLAEATALEQERNIRNTAQGFKSLDEKMLRSIAQSTIGDDHLDFTSDELPMVIATKMITGSLPR